MKYFSFIFANIIFNVDRNIFYIYIYNEIQPYFRKLYNQFLFKVNKNCKTLN